MDRTAEQRRTHHLTTSITSPNLYNERISRNAVEGDFLLIRSLKIVAKVESPDEPSSWHEEDCGYKKEQGDGWTWRRVVVNGCK